MCEKLSGKYEDLTLTPEFLREYQFKMPSKPANFNIILGYHANYADLDSASIRPILESADVILIEQVGWTAQNLIDLRDIAKNGIGERKGMNPYSLKMSKLISGTNAKYHFWDPFVDDNTRNEWRQYYSNYSVWQNAKSLDEYRNVLEFKCSLTAFRDKLALKEMCKKIDKLVPNQKMNEQINIVIMAGIMHQILGNRILAERDDLHEVNLIQAEIDDAPTLFMRKKLRSETIDDNELSRMLLLDIYTNLFAAQGESTVSILEKAQSELNMRTQEEVEIAINSWFATNA